MGDKSLWQFFRWGFSKENRKWNRVELAWTLIAGVFVLGPMAIYVYLTVIGPLLLPAIIFPLFDLVFAWGLLSAYIGGIIFGMRTHRFWVIWNQERKAEIKS